MNPDTVVPPGAFEAMVRFMDERPTIGVAGPRVRRPDGSLDRACRRSFPTPQVSFYRMVGLSRLFPHSRRFNAYNLEYLPEDAAHPVDSVVGAYMQVRSAAIAQAGLLDESFFMYGEDLDRAKRIKDAGWEVWYNGPVEILHVKEAASSQSAKSRIDFYEAMWLFYRKHYRDETNWLLDKTIMLGIVGKGGLDVSRHLWRYCRSGRKSTGQPTGSRQRSRLREPDRPVQLKTKAKKADSVSMQRSLSDLPKPNEYAARRGQRPGLMKRAQFAFMLALFVLDIACIGLAFWAAHELLVRTPDVVIGPFQEFWQLPTTYAMVLVAIYFSQRMYQRRRPVTHLDEFFRIIVYNVLATLFTVALLTLFLRDFQYHRALVLLGAGLTIVFDTLRA